VAAAQAAWLPINPLADGLLNSVLPASRLLRSPVLRRALLPCRAWLGTTGGTREPYGVGAISFCGGRFRQFLATSG